MFKGRVPAAFFTQEQPSIFKSCHVMFMGTLPLSSCLLQLLVNQLLRPPPQRYMMRHLDTELINVLENSVPPVDLALVSSFRMALLKHQKQAW